MPNILNGNSSANIFILGENGLCYGSADPERDQYWYGEEEDDSIIADFDGKKDSIRLAGIREDYLLRPTSLPFEIQGYPAGTVALGIFLTDRNNRYILEGGFTGRGNEITSIGWILPSPSNKTSFNIWLDQAGFQLDPSVNTPINNYGSGSNSNYYYDPSGKLLVFDGGAAPLQTASVGYLLGSSITQPGEGVDSASSLTVTSAFKNANNLDPIINFAPAQSKLRIDSTSLGIESSLAVSFKSAKSAKQIKSLAATKFSVIYSRKEGYVYLNANGKESGLGDQGGIIAHLDPMLSLSAANFEVF